MNRPRKEDCRMRFNSRLMAHAGRIVRTIRQIAFESISRLFELERFRSERGVMQRERKKEKKKSTLKRETWTC